MGQSRNAWVTHVLGLAGPKVTYYVTYATYYVTCKITDAAPKDGEMYGCRQADGGCLFGPCCLRRAHTVRESLQRHFWQRKRSGAHALKTEPVHSNELPDGIEPDEDEEAMMLSLLLRSACKVARASRLALLLSSCMPDQKNPLTL